MRIKNFDIHKAVLRGEDNQVLEYLYECVLPKIRTYLTNNSGNKEEADDIFQDVVINVYRKIKTKEIADIAQKIASA
jgi:DNA-directed RNA polymerase specialized sigma24 family protein